jgi:hypothetical protein
MTAEIPLHVIATDETGGATEREATHLEPESRAPTPFVSRGRVPAVVDLPEHEPRSLLTPKPPVSANS